MTKAQAALLHTVESAASSALLTLVVGLIQQLGTHQNNWSELFIIFASGFLGALGLVYKSVKADPSLPQAESDTAKEAKSLAQRALDHIENMWPILNAHTNALNTAQKPATPVTVNPTNTATIPQPSMIVQPSGVPQMAFPGTQTMLPGTTVYTGTVNLPPRSWSDTALTQAITPQPPKG